MPNKVNWFRRDHIRIGKAVWSPLELIGLALILLEFTRLVLWILARLG